MGNEAESPFPPNVTRKSSMYDICVGEITVGANAAEIYPVDIKDMRFDASVCGIVAGVLNQIDTEEYMSQIISAIMTANNLALSQASAEWNKFLDSVLTQDGNVIVTLPNEELKQDVALLKRRSGSVADKFHVI